MCDSAIKPRLPSTSMHALIPLAQMSKGVSTYVLHYVWYVVTGESIRRLNSIAARHVVDTVESEE